MDKALTTETMMLNMGPSHPATRGSLCVVLELDGETIVHAAQEIGYLHRCFEKEAEAHTWTQVIPYTDRLNFVSPLMNNVGYCMTVERLIGMEIPERAAWIRMLVCELSRIMDHALAIGSNLADIGAPANYHYLFNERERMTGWVEALTGARLTTSYTRIGGVVRDIPVTTKTYLRGCLKSLARAVRDVESLTKRNRILIDRTQGIGCIAADDAVAWGFTGPALRASGVAYDVRRAYPYYHYDELDWDVPIGHTGDTYDRIFVRMEEIKQSAHLIEQILERMPTGPIITDDRRFALPPKHAVYGSREERNNHIELCTRGFDVPAGEIYSCTEAANGELGFYIVSDGGTKPHRVKVRPPCFSIYQAYPDMIRGHTIADAVAILGSLNIVAGELDR